MQIIFSEHDVANAIAAFIHDRFITDEDTDVLIDLRAEGDRFKAIVDFVPSNPDETDDDGQTVEADNAALASDQAPKRRKRRTKPEAETEASASVEQPAFTPDKEIPIAAAEPVEEKPWEEEPAKEEIGSPEPAFTEAAPTVGSGSSSTSQETPIADTAPSQTETKATPSIFPSVGSSAPELPKVEPAVAAKSLFANLVKPTAH